MDKLSIQITMTKHLFWGRKYSWTRSYYTKKIPRQSVLKTGNSNIYNNFQDKEIFKWNILFVTRKREHRYEKRKKLEYFSMIPEYILRSRLSHHSDSTKFFRPTKTLNIVHTDTYNHHSESCHVETLEGFLDLWRGKPHWTARTYFQ